MGDIDAGGVERFGELLKDDDFHESFRRDPSGALERAGIPAGRLPAGLVDLVAGLSAEEMALFRSVQDKLSRAAQNVAGAVTFF